MNTFILDIIEFYKNPENRKAFEEWKKKREQQEMEKEVQPS